MPAVCERLVQAPRTNPAQVLDGQVARQREEPGVEIAAGIEGPNLLDHFQPRLLEQILRFDGLPDDAQQVAIQPILVAGNQFRKSVQVASPKPDHVRIHCHEPLQR